jgi:hypothetical protein
MNLTRIFIPLILFAVLYCLFLTDIKAQTDAPIYNLWLKNGTSFTCRLLQEKKGEYIKVLKADSSVVQLDWDLITDYKPASKRHGELTEADSAKYTNWFKCIIISDGDTISALTKPRNDYCNIKASTVLMPNGRERRLEPSDIAGLWILAGSDTVKYISLNLGNEVYCLYRLIIDGPCKLLYSEGIEFVRNMDPEPRFSAPSPTGASGWSYGGLEYVGVFSIYYKGTVWKIAAKGKNEVVLAYKTDFSDFAKQAFKDCKHWNERSDAVGKEKLDLESDQINIAKAIREFNECLGFKTLEREQRW